MNLFGKLPQEQAMQSLIHDTNSALGGLADRISIIKKWLDDNAKDAGEKGINTTELIIQLERLRQNRDRIRKTVDRYYEEFKNDFPEK